MGEGCARASATCSRRRRRRHHHHHPRPGLEGTVSGTAKVLPTNSTVFPTDEATNREHRSPRHSDERVFRRRRTCVSAYPSALYLSHEPGSDSGGDGARKDFGARTWPKSLLLLARRDSSHSAYAKRTRSETRSITVVNRWIIEGSNNERYYKKKERNKADR